MAFGFPPHAKAVKSFENCASGDLLDAMHEAIERLFWPADHVGPCSLIARVPWTENPLLKKLVWREVVVIEVSNKQVFIRSESSQWIAWDLGRNERNINKLLCCLTEIINQRTSGQRVPQREEKRHEQGIYSAQIRGVRGPVSDGSPTPPTPSSVDSQSRPRDDVGSGKPDPAAFRPARPSDQERNRLDAG